MGKTLHSSLAIGVVAADTPELHELVLRNAERLIHRRNDLDDLVVKVAVRTFGDLGQKDIGDGLSVLVELHLASRRVELERGQSLPKLLLSIGEIGADLVERQQNRRGIDVL